MMRHYFYLGLRGFFNSGLRGFLNLGLRPKPPAAASGGPFAPRRCRRAAPRAAWGRPCRRSPSPPWAVLLAAVVLLAAGDQPAAQGGGAFGSPIPLIEAAKDSDLATVRALIDSGADVNAAQSDGATALHWAAYREDFGTAALLIRAGADVNKANDLGVTPLLMASTNGHAGLVEALLAAGADPNAALPSGETPLMAASRAGIPGAVESLLRRGADVNAAEQTRGQTALMWAVANRHSGVAAALIGAGGDIHARSQVRYRVYNMGGNRSAGSASSGIPLEEVAIGGSTPLLFAARSGDVESARLLLDAGADLHDPAADGNVLLVIAAHSGHASLAGFLLERGADVDAAPLGYTALHAAVLRGDLRDRRVRNADPAAGLPLVETLLAHGADPNARLTQPTPVRRWSHDFALMNRWLGATPYWLASKFLELEMMRVLAAAGADTRMASDDGTTPLMAAAGLGYSRGGGSAFIKDRRDFSSYNPVASAEQGSRIPAAEERFSREAVALAIELGGDVAAVSVSGDTALHAAASHGMDSVVELLVEHGADLHVANERGRTPADMAVYREGIAGAPLVRESTVGLLRELDPDRHPAEPHPHPEAQELANPIESNPESRAAGAEVYERLCATCHGPTGRGDGRLAAGTAAYGARPSNLADDTWQHGSTDGEIFAVIRDGIGPDFAMDSFDGPLSADEIWDVVNYLKSLGGSR